MTARIALPDGCELIEAGALCSEHIGETIRFHTWDERTEVGTVVTAELRQIHHNLSGTAIYYGVGAEANQEFPDSAVLVLHPDEEYDDMPSLIFANKEADRDRETAS